MHTSLPSHVYMFIFAILKQLHTGMCAQLVMSGSQCTSFSVDVKVKQGCSSHCHLQPVLSCYNSCV